MAEDKDLELKELLEEVKGIRRLLIVSLLRSGMKPEVLAKILGYKHSRSLSNEFPLRKIRESVKD